MVAVADKDISPATVLLPLAEMDGEVATESVEVTLPAYCSSDSPVVRAASAQAKAELRQFWAGLLEDQQLYAVLSRLKAKYPALPDADQARLLDRYLRDFRRTGMHLAPEQRARLAALRQREGELCAQFEQNINENADAVLFTREELAGVSESYLNSAPVDPATGKVKVGLKFPEASPVLQYANSAATRRITEEARLSRCPANAPILKELAQVMNPCHCAGVGAQPIHPSNARRSGARRPSCCTTKVTPTMCCKHAWPARSTMSKPSPKT